MDKAEIAMRLESGCHATYTAAAHSATEENDSMSALTYACKIVKQNVSGGHGPLHIHVSFIRRQN